MQTHSNKLVISTTAITAVVPGIVITLTRLTQEASLVDQLVFSMITMSKGRFIANQEQAFYWLNKYWSTLSDQEREDIFKLYNEAKQVFDYVHFYSKKTLQLKHIVTELAKLHSLQKVGAFVDLGSDIKIPPIPVSFVPSIEKAHTRDRTYIRSDYVELVHLGLAIRFMIPLWHQYVTDMAETVGEKYVWKYAFLLVENTEYFECPAMVKIKLYGEGVSRSVGSIGGDGAAENSALQYGESKEDYPLYLLSALVVKRLSVVELSCPYDDGNTLINRCFKFLIQRVSPRAQSPSSIIRNKRPVDEQEGANTDPDAPSAIEGIKISYDLTSSEVAEITHAVSSVENVCALLAPSMDVSYAYSAIETSREFIRQSKPFCLIHLNFLRWILKPIISPVSIDYLPDATKADLLGVVQAILAHRGHLYLSVLSTSFAADNGAIAIPDAKLNYSQSVVDRLTTVFPMKKPAHLVFRDIKQQYLIFSTLDTTVDEISSKAWTPTADPDTVMKVVGRRITSTLPHIGDIKNLLAELIIELGQRSWKL